MKRDKCLNNGREAGLSAIQTSQRVVVAFMPDSEPHQLRGRVLVGELRGAKARYRWNYNTLFQPQLEGCSRDVPVICDCCTSPPRQPCQFNHCMNLRRRRVRPPFKPVDAFGNCIFHISHLCFPWRPATMLPSAVVCLPVRRTVSLCPSDG